MLLRLKLFLAVFLISASAFAVTATEYYQAGNAFYQQSQWEKAAQYYKAALQADPSMWQAQMGLGNADYRLGKKAEALQAYDASLALHPDNPSLKSFADKLRAQLPSTASAASPGDSWTTPPASMPDFNNPGLPNANTSSTDSAGLPGLTASATPEWKMENKLAKMSGLPKAGRIGFGAGSSGILGGSQDLTDYYGPYLLTPLSLSTGGDFYLGADYTIIPNAQIGLQFQGLYKIPKIFEDGSGDTELWREFALGGVIVGRGLLSLSSNMNLILRLEGGFYTMVFSAIDFTDYYYGSYGAVNLDASGFGGTVGLELEILQNISGTWALDLGLGYRFLSFSPLKMSGSYGGSPVSGNLTNWDGSDARADFSGVRFSAGVRFY